MREGFRLDASPTPIGDLVRRTWAARPLIAMLARKDFLVQYRRASFGVAWALLLPFVQAVVLAIVLREVAGIETGVNYVTFIFAGMVIWTFLSAAVAKAVASVVEGSAIASKVYFPRPVLPLVSVAAEAYGLVAGLVVLVPMCVITDVSLGIDLLWLAPGVALAYALTASLGLVLGALQVYFRDVKYLTAAVIRPWFYLTPVFYPLDFVDGALRTAIEINPATGVVQVIRAATVGEGAAGLTSAWYTVGWVVALVAGAAYLYRRYDRVFVDLL